MGESIYNAPPFSIDDAPATPVAPAPLLGQHTKEVLTDDTGTQRGGDRSTATRRRPDMSLRQERTARSWRRLPPISTPQGFDEEHVRAMWSSPGGYDGRGYRRAKRACRPSALHANMSRTLRRPGRWTWQETTRHGKPVGMRTTSTIEGAALFNGIAAHVLDFDDASLADERPSECRTSARALSRSPKHVDRRGYGAFPLTSSALRYAASSAGRLILRTIRAGWHMTATMGTIAAAAACGHLLELDAERITHAIGLAMAQTGGTRENFGTNAKSFQAGQAERGRDPSCVVGRAGLHRVAACARRQSRVYLTLYSAGEDITPSLATLGALPLEIDGSGIEVKKYAGLLRHPSAVGWSVRI